ncbi:MAG: DUF6029 family protein [Candidatus Cloacimonetes bacterium]|nr:DUF6029 family protein [Candidatus Cloacimonadota bacterium]MDD2505873.1 DUF6029 family protein [Candidatus Cloacimonadota bacterium]MDD4559284.1 DUF6029 family protein [Candidatus Cloacimonadota bacterium]
MKWKLVIILVSMMLPLLAQNTLQINGINEAEFVYRTAEDSLNAYFSDEFGFNLAYRDFNFGMKFISDLPKYSNEQTQLMDEIDPNRLSVEWEELYAGFSRENFSIHVGTTEETFGNGIVFRSFKDLEFDEDHRLQSFLMRYDGALKLKGIYGAIDSETNASRYDIAYGADAEYPLFAGLRLGASAMAFRNLNPMNTYSYQDVFGGRMHYSTSSLEGFGEYALSKRYKSDLIQQGHAAYANVDYYVSDLQFGAAYKNYLGFDYRQNDIPLANYHGETLADVSASGMDEEGWQARAAYALFDNYYFSADYAEAWDRSEDRRMNDLYVALDMTLGSGSYQVAWSQIEKVDDGLSAWQKEYYPTLAGDMRLFGLPVHIKGEFKVMEKRKNEKETEHYEPQIQADFALDKLSVSLGLQSWWEEFDTAIDSKYNPNIELKYPLFTHSDLVVFAGKEQGGKVCRNGVCKFVAPFEGIKAELTTRF